MGSDDPLPSEETQLLAATTGDPGSINLRKRRLAGWRILPIAFVGGFTIAGTVPSILFVYQSILCQDVRRCTSAEKGTYRTTFAAATAFTNVISVLILGPAQRIGHWSRRAGLSLWLVARALSIFLFVLAGRRLTPPCCVHIQLRLSCRPVFYPQPEMLMILASSRSLVPAFAAQAFEGLSADNLLHFNLNAAYTETASDDGQVSRLFALSLGLFMAGMGFGPAASVLLPDPRLVFCLAAAMLTISVGYVLSLLVPWPEHRDRPQGAHELRKPFQWRNGLATLFGPLLFFWHHPSTLLHALALLAFTCGQAFFFPSLLIYASTDFGLDSRQIAVLITVICAASSVNLLVLTLLPRLSQVIAPLTFEYPPSRISSETLCACWSMLIFSVASFGLVALGSDKSRLYTLAILCSLGNATPPFVKSHLIARLPQPLQPPALASVALCETAGSLLSPLVVGGAWARGLVDPDTFPIFALITAILVIAANVAFSAAAACAFPAQRLAKDVDGERRQEE